MGKKILTILRLFTAEQTEQEADNGGDKDKDEVKTKNEDDYDYYDDGEFSGFVYQLIVPRLFEEKRVHIVFDFSSFHPCFRPSVSLHVHVVVTLCMQLLLQFYSNSFETLHVLRKMCILFRYYPQIIIVTFFPK